MSGHREHAEELLESLDSGIGLLPTGDLLVTALAALAQSNLALVDSQDCLAAQLGHPTGYRVRKDGLVPGSFRIAPEVSD